jgi:hypothetical protein
VRPIKDSNYYITTPKRVTILLKNALLRHHKRDTSGNHFGQQRTISLRKVNFCEGREQPRQIPIKFTLAFIEQRSGEIDSKVNHC